MRNLIECIKESILDDDEKITNEYGDEFEAEARYKMFLDCFSDILYKDTPYSQLHMPTTSRITFEFSREIQNVTGTKFYDIVEYRLKKYIKQLNKTYKNRCSFSYNKPRRNLHAAVLYYIEMRIPYDNSHEKYHTIEFTARNVLDGRRVDIEWISDNTSEDDNRKFEFMKCKIKN